MSRALRVPNAIDYERLLATQHPDGSWDPSPAWLAPAVGGTGYNRVLDTAFAAQAIRTTLAAVSRTSTNDHRVDHHAVNGTGAIS
ncbi:MULTISPECIES: hypothetical protein [unclassified Streptomyces]|uniref:hypothetical protein n=1 Tax=unclassified Streptomyces TaxID=2593676 RepID=UPI00340D7F48